MEITDNGNKNTDQTYNNEYLSSLNTINKIRFTDREIDLIACIIGGRTTKKIASILSITPKTVENYIRNITLRLGINSREKIIDFIERSPQFSRIKEHYFELLTRYYFEKEITKISNASTNINCIIFHYGQQKSKEPTIVQLEKHLALAGVKVTSKLWETKKAILVLDRIEEKQTVFIIYSVSAAFATHLQTANYNIISEINEIKSSLKEKNDPIIVLFLDKQSSKFKTNLSDIPCLELWDPKKYYLSVFAILQRLLYKINIEHNITLFKKQCEIYLLNANGEHAKVSENNLWQQSNPSKFKFYEGRRLKFVNIKQKLQEKTMSIILIVCLTLGLFTGIRIFYAKNTSSESIVSRISSFIRNKIYTTTNSNRIILNLPQRNANFTGRKEALVQINEQLGKQQFGVITQAISGLGGIGKTQLAMEFAYQSAETYKYSAIFWVPAETNTTIGNTYKEIADYLHLNVKGLELDNIQTIVHKKLASVYHNAKVLFILDNVPEYNTINEYLEKIHKELSPALAPYILITSRSQHWPEVPLILDPFTEEEALIFVQKYLPSEQPNNINKLTSTLHYFPLALGQAVAYIKTHTNIDDYLTLYASKQQDYLNKFPQSKNQYNESLWKTWNITLSKLSNTAQELLFISAYLDPDEIPFDLFENLTIEERANALEELRKYSLITLINNQSFKIHRLLQEVIRLNVNCSIQQNNELISQPNSSITANYWLNKAMDLLETKFDFDYLQPKQWMFWSKYLPQALAIANHAIEMSEQLLQPGLKLYIKCAMFLTYIQCDGKYSIEPWSKVLLLIQQYYNTSAVKLITASINSHLGFAKNWLGKYQETKELLNNVVLPVYEQSIPALQVKEQELLDLLRIIPFNNNTNDTIKQKSDLNFALTVLGHAQYKSGFIHEGITAYNKALKAIENETDQISQYYKIETLWILGRAYIYSGQFIEAEKMLLSAKAGTDRFYANHIRQTYAYANLALLMYHLGDFKEASKLLKKCVEIRHSSFSPQHIHHADTQIKLGLTNCMLHKTVLAIQNFTKAESIYKLYREENDRDYVFTNLGFWKTYEAAGQYDKVLDFMNKTLKIAELRYKNNINYGMAFQLTQAEIWPELTTIGNNISYWGTALELSNKMFGDRHYQSARYHYMLGLSLEHEHKIHKAHDHYQQALNILNIQDIKHPKLKQIYLKNINSIQLGLQRTQVEKN